MTQTELHLERCKVFCLLILAAGAILTGLYLSSDVLVPIVLAWLLSSLLLPIVKFGNRYRINSAVIAAISLGSLLALIMSMSNFLIEPASELIKALPARLDDFRNFFSTTDGSLGDLQRLSEEVRDLTDLESSAKGGEPLAVEIKDTSALSSFLMDSLPRFMGYLIVTLVLTFFLLSSNQHFLRRMVKLNSTWAGKRRTVTIAVKIQHDISRYLSVVTIINLALGLLVAGYLYLLDVPNPIFWGALAALLNFVPYIGAMATICLLAMVGLTETDVMADALAVPGIFMVLTIIEGQFITPAAVGRSLRLSPVSVFLGVIIWSWLWGIPGALMAAPMLAAMKILFASLPGIYRLQMILKIGSTPVESRIDEIRAEAEPVDPTPDEVFSESRNKQP